jgi:hypothetical protein
MGDILTSNGKENPPLYIIKMPKLENKERILKATREKYYHT